MVVIVLRVFFQRMIVALGAADADAEERLGGIGDDGGLVRFALLADVDDKIADGGLLVRGAGDRSKGRASFRPRGD